MITLSDRVPATILNNGFCEGAACYTIKIECPDTTPSYYDVFLTMDNLGKLKYGNYKRGYRVIQKQYNRAMGSIHEKFVFQ